MTVRRMGALALVAGAAGMVLAGCGSDEEADQRLSMVQGRPVPEAVAELGGSCETAGLAGRMSCTYKGSSFVLSPNSWEAKAGQRERDCQTEAVSETMQVLTNHRWMITADDEDSLNLLRSALATKGAPSEMVGYCDWDNEG